MERAKCRPSRVSCRRRRSSLCSDTYSISNSVRALTAASLTGEKMKKVKLICLLAFATFGVAMLFTGNSVVTLVQAYSTGPPPGVTGAPGELTCTECHFQHAGPGMLSITAPPNYVPGQTYQIQVQHATIDSTRMRWGFELTALANFTSAGSF